MTHLSFLGTFWCFTSRMTTKYEIERFNGNNFSLWKLKIKAIFRKDNCIAAMEGKPAEMTEHKWKEIDNNAIANLHLSMADSVLSSVAEKETAREIWDALIKLYEVKSLHTRIFLKRKLYTLRMSESTMVTDHINHLNTLFAQLSAADFNIVENECAELLLQSLPDSYDQLIINITNNNVEGCLHFEDIAGAILEEESRRRNKEDMLESSKQTQALVMMRQRSTKYGSSGSQSHDRSQSKKHLKCYNCGKRGHVKKECWHEKSGRKNSEASTSQGCMANTLEDEDIL